MSNPFVAEIRLFAGNFAPNGWAICDGQLLPISQNTALFSLIGTLYGGDGKSTFALPNFQGVAPLHHGQGPGLSQRDLGETGGEQSVTLLTTEMPAHAHTVQGATLGGVASPVSNAWGSARRGLGNLYSASSANNVPMSAFGTTVTGGNLPHNNMPPYLCLTFIIALVGVFPARP
jgi:microcystin-dependent protein